MVKKTEMYTNLQWLKRKCLKVDYNFQTQNVLYSILIGAIENDFKPLDIKFFLGNLYF